MSRIEPTVYPRSTSGLALLRSVAKTPGCISPLMEFSEFVWSDREPVRRSSDSYLYDSKLPQWKLCVTPLNFCYYDDRGAHSKRLQIGALFGHARIEVSDII